MKAVVAILAAAVAAAAAVPLPGPASFSRTRATPGQTSIAFKVALPMQNLDVLDARFWSISTPGSPEYGKFMSTEELNRLTAADKTHKRAAMRFFKRHGASCAPVTADALACTAPAAAVERIIGAPLQEWRHETTGRVVHRVHPRDYHAVSFPAELEGHATFLSGLVGFPVPHYGQTRSVVQGLTFTSRAGVSGAYSADMVIPETLANQYSLAGGAGSAQSVQAAAEFQNLGAWTTSDLATFITNTSIPKFSVEHIVGSYNPLSPQGESTLDVQYLGAVGAGNTNWYWTEADWMWDFAVNALSKSSSDLPDVFSMSYGWAETQQCVVAPFTQPCNAGGSTEYVKTVNTNFQKLGAAGVTLVAAAGDSGAFGRSDPACISGHTNPAFPASSPYVTAVGATQLMDATTGGTEPICTVDSCALKGTEAVCSTGTGALITSGGGFSTIAARPAYQDAVVSAYLKKAGVTPPASYFNAAGRGYPDVAALGHKFYIVYEGQDVQADGTSCACPVFAGVLGLMNAARASGGKPKIGFANPLLYKIAAASPAAFTDITVGDNYCTEELCCPVGFNATTGWDATSGLGTPNLPALLKGDAALLAA